MTPIQLIYRSLVFFWRSHLTVTIGVAICTMVITGTLIVGDSIRTSLEETTFLRLGNTEYLFSGTDRYFSSKLAESLKKDIRINAVPILQLNGFASSQGGKFKLNGVQVIGINDDFQSLAPENAHFATPGNNEAHISENLAQRLQLKPGDALVLRVEKASQIPKNAPFVTDAENQISIRLNVKKIMNAGELGRFNLKTSQTAPYNVFLSLSFLNDQMELVDKANKILLSGTSNIDQGKINAAINKHWHLEDMALEIVTAEDSASLEIRSDRIFMDSSIVRAVHQVNPEATAILTYMINSFKKNGKETPYSFMAAGPFLASDIKSNNEMAINTWMAEDLDASVGDSIKISYFIIGPLRQLKEASKWFTVGKIVDMQGIYADRSLMPDLPGMSDAGNCRDWEAGVPIDLDKIRDKDEDYWNTYRGTPKAFIPYGVGKALWQNRFGVCTAIRMPAKSMSRDLLETKLTEVLSPNSLGFTVRSVKNEGLAAASNGVDFAQLFMGLSFFLLVAGLILLALFFNLHLEKRIAEIGTLKALGYPYRVIKNIILSEGLLITIPGILLGAILAIAYNKIIFYALNTVWYDIVRTSILKEVILPKTMILGMLAALILVSISIWYNVNRRLKIASSSLQRKLHSAPKTSSIRWLKIGSSFSAIIAIGLLVYETLFGKILNTGIFFSAGALLLLSFILFFSSLIRKESVRPSQLSLFTLILKNLSRNTARSSRIIILFALGTFIIISTGLNKKDLHQEANVPTSGTGGFQFYMETTIPVLKDLNDPNIQVAQGIEKPLDFVQMRKSEGDDASCLNLNRVASPRILGVPAHQLSGRFSFIKSTEDLNQEDPWSSLTRELPGSVIPAVLDQTVIQWGLGKKVGDTLVYMDEHGKEMRLKIIGGLANSIFQGNVLIDDQLFLKHFPSSSGSNVFLADGEADELEENKIELSRALRNEGLEIENTVDRLAMFNQVENTYLSIFLLLGGLAMILGTVGLGMSLARNIMDRAQEIGILRAIGFRQSSILKIVTYEHLILLSIGTLSGLITALIATLPSIVSEFVQASWQTALIIIALILLNGVFWIVGITKNFLNKNLVATLRTE